MNTNKFESHINQPEYSSLKPSIKFTTFNSPSNPKHKRIRFQKKKSRISLAVEKTSSSETLSERETKASSFSSFDSSTESPKHITHNGYLITVNISVVMLNNIKRISFDVNSNTKIAMIIDKAITAFNKEFKNDNVNIRIKDEPECFVLKPAKKNGQPKMDLPFFNEHMVVHETKRENFALCWKDDPDDYQQMFKSKQKNNDCICFIF